MAQSQKIKIPPLEVPDSLAILMEVFSIESEVVAKTLIKKAFATIYFEKEDRFNVVDKEKFMSKEEADDAYILIKAIAPSNIVESFYAAQIVLNHLLGMRKLLQSYKDDQRLGLKLLRLSTEALERLERERLVS